MNHKFKIATLITIVVIIFGFWFVRSERSVKEDIAPIENSVVMQLIPLPMIVDGAKKDNQLYELLVNKEAAQVTFSNVSIDIEQVFVAPVVLKNLSINFTYNKETNRVEFQGQSNSDKYMKISGYYKFTSKNSIKYYINVQDEYKTWVVDSTYTPPYKDNKKEHEEVVVGDFSLEASDLLRANYNFDSSSNRFIPKWPLSMKGHFVKKENFLNIKDFYLKADEVEASITAKFKDKKLNLDAALSAINLDKILPYFPAGEVDRLLSTALKNIADLTINGTFNCNKITLNRTDLKSVLIAFSQKEKESLKISKLNFIFPDNSVFQSSGKISHIEEKLGIEGAFHIVNTQANVLAKALGLGNYSGKDLVSLSSKFELTPSMLKLENLKLQEGAAAASGNLFFSKYVSTKMLTGNVGINSYNTKPTSFIGHVLYKNALSSDAPGVNYKEAFKQDRKEKYLKDITFEFSDLKTASGIVKKISMRYIQTPDSIELEQFKAEDPKFNAQGNIKFSFKEGTPNLDVNFEGDHVDMSIFNDVILKPFLYKRSAANKDIKFSFPKFKSASGDIKINLSNQDKDTYISGVNCVAKLNDQTVVLNNCFLNLFDGQAYLNGKISLGEFLGYDISFLHKNANMKKLVNCLFGENKKIMGEGSADINGNIAAFDFSTRLEMTKNLSGVFKLKSDRFCLTDVSLKSIVSKYGKIKNIYEPGVKKETEFNNVNGEFNLAKEKLESKNLTFITKENIYCTTNFTYKLLNKNMNGVLSLAYFDKLGKIDGFNITFYGDVRKLQTKLGTHADKRDS